MESREMLKSRGGERGGEECQMWGQQQPMM